MRGERGRSREIEGKSERGRTKIIDDEEKRKVEMKG